MKHVALTGSILSGKTTVAQELEKRGYKLLSFTNLLKRLYAAALTLAGVPTTPEDILANKPNYRVALQEFGRHIGFDDNPRFIQMALMGWNGGPAVFDNIRTDEQAEAIRAEGFQIVQLDIDRMLQQARAEDQGILEVALIGALAHPVERGISDYFVDLELQAGPPAAHLADVIEGHPVVWTCL